MKYRIIRAPFKEVRYNLEHRNDIYQAVEIIALAYIIYRLAS